MLPVFDMNDDALTDSVLIVRCPYCAAGQEFLLMLAYKDGRYVCLECAHTQRPGDPNYKCQCRSCIRGRQLADRLTSMPNPENPH